MITYDELLSVLTIVNISVDKVYRYNNQIWIRCPFPHNKNFRENKPSLAVKLTNDSILFYCKACHFSGNQISLAKKLYPNNYNIIKKIQSILTRDLSYYINEPLQYEIPTSSIYYEDSLESIRKLYDSLEIIEDYHITYFTQRNISYQSLQASRCRCKKEFVYFPIYSDYNRTNLVGLQYKNLKNHQWLIYRGFKKDQYLYFITNPNLDDKLTVCEGIGDVLRLHSENVNSIAILGSSMSKVQAQKIVDLNKHVNIFLDGDMSGRNGTDQIIKRIGKILPYSIIECPIGYDPGNIKTELIEELLLKN